jgi:endonuclease-3
MQTARFYIVCWLGEPRAHPALERKLQVPDLPADPAIAAQIYRCLLAAYGSPDWRPTNPALDELVLTILSQNTSDVNSGRAFEALKARYPVWRAVMEAPVDELAETIRSGGLGKQKAPRIQAALRRILEERGEFSLDFLRDMPAGGALRWLTAIGGVGLKTASIVLLFSFGQPAFPVDTHITRITRRLGFVGPKASPDKISELWASLVPPTWYFPLHLNLLRHGREVCRAPTPRCALCILHDICRYPEKTG